MLANSSFGVFERLVLARQNHCAFMPYKFLVRGTSAVFCKVHFAALFFTKKK
jgi:hypothetical protein